MEKYQNNLQNAAGRLADAAKKFTDYSLQFNETVQYGMMESNRQFFHMDELLKQLDHPLGSDGAETEVVTRENYEIYSCLKNMPECIKSMKLTRGDKGGEIGTNRPLQNTICFAIHHLDDKTLGGMCVLREWGADEMNAVFVGYNPLQTQIWYKLMEDIEEEKFSSCILEAGTPKEGKLGWAEGIYKIAKDFIRMPKGVSLPVDKFNRIFEGENIEGKPLSFLYAQRSLCVYNFLRSLAGGRQKNKKVFIWEDGGYLNPIIDNALEDDITVKEFRERHMVPEDPETDEALPAKMSDALSGVFVGTVELTRNGYDMSADIAEKRPMHTRLFSIAASYEKIMLEGDSITLACLDALSQVLYSTGNSLRRRKVLIMGARGNLGRLCAGHLTDILEDSTKQLWGCDLKLNWPSPEKDSIPEWARWSASDIPLKGVVKEVAAFRELPEKDRYDLDVIFGWTGGPRKVKEGGKTVEYETISGQDVAEWLTEGKTKSRLYLVSGSTKTIEFAHVLDWLADILNEFNKKECKINGIPLEELRVEPIPDQLSIAAVHQMWPEGTEKPEQIKRNFGTQFTFVFQQEQKKVEKTIYLVNNTMPVNFMYYGTPAEIMDMTYSQVTSCAVALMKNENVKPGIYPTDYSVIASKDVYLARDLDRDYKIPSSI